MAPIRKNAEGLLARVNFPLYAVQMLTSRHVLVAGGGGSSKTGVANGFEIFELSHNGDRFVAEEVIRHETGPSVVMNCAAHNNGRHTYLVAGQESHCQLYNVAIKVVDQNVDNHVLPEKKEKQKSSARRRRKSEKESDSDKSSSKTDSNSTSTSKKSEERNSGVEDLLGNNVVNENHHSSDRKLQFVIKPNDSIQTDFSKEEPLQRVVRIGHSGKLMVTGGTDGYIRLWNFPKMTQKLEVAAHSKEVDDLDISPNEKLVVSLSKDGNCILWNTSNGKEVHKLSWPIPEGSKYLFKRCRFAYGEGSLEEYRLFTITNPIGRLGKQKAYLQLWDPSDASLKKVADFSESLSALAVSDDGKFVAVGTMFSGSVSLYIAFSLQQVLHVENVHSMFVTGLEFLPTALDGPPVSSTSEAAVVSISVDNKICIHSINFRRTLPFWLAVVLIICSMFLAFMLCSYLGI